MIKNRILIGLLIALAIITIGAMAAAGCILYQKHKAPQLYKQGFEYYTKKDYQNAYYNFSRVYPGSDLYFNALYYQGKCSDLLGDKENAVQKYSMLAAFLKDENVAPYFLWRAAALSEDTNAKKYYLKLKKDYAETEYGIAANWGLAKLEDDEQEKLAYLIEYTKCSPNGKFIKEVLAELISGNYKLNGAQKIIAAKGLYENGVYNNAAAILKEAPIELSWPLFIDVLDKLKSGKNVIRVANKGFSLDNSRFDEDVLLGAVTIYSKYYPMGAENALENVYKNAADRRIKGVALYKIPQFLPPQKRLRYRAEFYEKFKDSKFAPNALRELFMQALKNNETQLALKYGETYISLYRNEYTPAILYFTALLKKQNSDSSYKLLARNLINNHFYSYYAYLAYKNLLQKDFSQKKNLKIPVNKRAAFPYPANFKLAHFFENFAAYGDFTPFDEDFRIKDPLIKSWVEYKKGNRAVSCVLARDWAKQNAPKRDNMAWKLAYPIYYANEINIWAADRKLSPFLMLAMVKEESHFIPEIRSPAGATGLMQIMPKTAEMVAGKAFSSEELTHENLNIKLGTLYFQNLMQTFSNNEPLCVLAYNSGPNAVKKWLAEKPNLQFDLFVETIPYSETKEYIKKIYSAYWNYLILYGGLNP